MSTEIWVAGYPGLVGGADTELDHNIDLWREFGSDVHLVPMPWRQPDGTLATPTQPADRMRELCDRRGCTTHLWRPDIFKGKVVVSFCNGGFLEALPEIAAEGKPSKTIWFNCMTWLFPKEIEAHRLGLIDIFGFQSRYQRDRLVPELSRHNPVTELTGYRPYFSLNNAGQSLVWSYRAPDEYFGQGRISRSDAAKFPEDLWKIFGQVTAPRPVKTFVLGWSEKVREKCGEPHARCPWLDYLLWGMGGTSAKDFYARLHVLIHKTGGSRENWPRVVIESFAAGVVPIVEHDYGFADLIADGVDGFLCSSSEEMSYRASQLAWDEDTRRRMVFAGHETLLREHADPARCWQPWQAVLEVDTKGGSKPAVGSPAVGSPAVVEANPERGLLMHQVWVGPRPIPQEYQRYRQSWIEQHPAAEHKLWRDDDIDGLLSSGERAMLEAMDNHATRCDYLRFKILYLYGGIYMDMDFECVKPLDRYVTAHPAWMAYESACNDYVNNAIIGLPKFHPLAAEFLEKAPARFWSDPRGYPPHLVGPHFVMREILPHHPEVFRFPYYYFYPFYYNEPPLLPEQVGPQTYAIHHWSFSWQDRIVPQGSMQ